MGREDRKPYLYHAGIGLTLLATLSGCRPNARPAPAPTSLEQVSIGIPQEPLAALLIIAAEQGFFSQAGLDATIVDTYPSGKRALEGMLNGEVELTVSSEAPLVFRGFDRADFRIVATVGSSDNEPRIIARMEPDRERKRKRKRKSPANLRGKRIATQRGSAVHYFLHLFLLKHELAGGGVEVSYLKAEELPQALADGKIDAFSMREPFISRARLLLDNGAVVFEEPGLYVKTMNLVTRNDVIQAKPAVIERVLQALARAEVFVHEHPDEARGLVAAKLGNVDPQFTDIWSQMTLEISLGHSLLVSLEDEARWAVGEGLMNGGAAPDYFEFFYLDAIKRVKPDSVTVIE